MTMVEAVDEDVPLHGRRCRTCTLLGLPRVDINPRRKIDERGRWRMLLQKDLPRRADGQR